jgi:Domain of unknown function (DUF4148)
MKIKNIAVLALATLIAAPAFAATDYYSPAVSGVSATQPAGLTRAQVRAQLVQLEKAGYTSGGENVHYPEDIQAAEAKVEAQNALAQAQAADDSGVGGGMSGSSEAGHSVSAVDMNVMYGRH